jgi:tRNA threonylcarbamoyladenosine biosynthesis protein TsaE
VRESVAGTSKQWRSPSAEATEAYGSKLAAARPPRPDALTVVYLTGDLGAGKTTFSRGFLRAVGVEGVVRSPTYTLLETYETPSVTVVHLDLYRLRDTAELEPLGLRDMALPGYVWLIEWPELGAGGLPPADLHLALTIGEGRDAGSHGIVVQGVSDYGRAWLQRLDA